MSRTFSKILVICAMVVVLPLLVVGTVFAAYHSIDSTVKVGVVFVNDEKVSGDITDIYATVKYGDENSEKLEIVKGHTQTATVSAVFSEKAYTFEGWFMGDADAYKKAVTSGNANLDKSSEITFDMSSTTDVVAVYSVHKFTISYTGDEAPENAVTYVKYGDKLADPKSKTNSSIADDKCYRGWVVNGDTSAKRYKYATFDGEGPYTLENPIDTRKSVNLTLKQGETTQSYTAYVEDKDANETPVKLNSLDIDTVFSTGVKKAGYKYSWKDSEGNVVNEVPAENAEYTLNEETIQYKANITTSENITDQVASATFTVESYEAISNLFNLKSKYSFFEVKQIKVGGTQYSDAGTFVNAFVAANPEESATAEITVDSESKYDKIKVASVMFKAKTSELIYDKTVYSSAGSALGGSKNDGWDAADTNREVEGNASIYKLLNMLLGNGPELQTFYSDEHQQNQVTAKEIRIVMTGDDHYEHRIDLNSDMTIYDFMQIIFDNKWASGVSERGTFEIQRIDVLFE